MNLMTKFDLSSIVYHILDDLKEYKMQVTEISIYMDGGYKYYCKWVDPEHSIVGGSFFEGELKGEDE
ncbi:hypothetical protein LCGC14_1407900 [marine sediment metagenome]|uniref:Uncharacterized protein n=1 Tax=marine sediment metagenome TaxID=412755 RepID=A0A0F9MWT3_9ZZZZ